MPAPGKVDVIVGVQWGDEGKGKAVHYLLDAGKYEWCARYQGGGNAGHTIYDQEDGQKVVLHSIPSGIVYEGMPCMLGNGELVDLEDLKKEIATLTTAGKFRGNLYISDRAHVTHPYLKELESGSGDKTKFGTTGHAIGPTYMLMVARKGLRVCDFESRRKVADRIREGIEFTAAAMLSRDTLYALSGRKNPLSGGEKKLLKKLLSPEYARDMAGAQMKLFDGITESAEIADCSYTIGKWIEEGKSGLAEGAQGTGLSIYHGTYPDVTSSNTEAGGACTGLGTGPGKIGKVYGVAKAYVTRVGTGPFPTLMDSNTEEAVRKKGSEFGATTGRPRRCGWWDSVLARHAVRVSGIDELIITKPDILSGMDRVIAATAYRKADREEKTELFPPDLVWDNKEIPNSSNYSGAMDYEQRGWKPFKNIDFPKELSDYLAFIENSCGAPVTILSTGPGINDTVELKGKSGIYN